MGWVIPQCLSPLSGGFIQVYHYQLMCHHLGRHRLSSLSLLDLITGLSCIFSVSSAAFGPASRTHAVLTTRPLWCGPSSLVVPQEGRGHIRCLLAPCNVYHGRLPDLGLVGCGDPICLIPEAIGRGVFNGYKGCPRGMIEDVDVAVGSPYALVVVEIGLVTDSADRICVHCPQRGTRDKLTGIPGLRGYTGVTHLTGGGTLQEKRRWWY
ncbi:hypothetical protein EDB86DRAFT_3242551 [Lactarius hatsudake]|nr:hypothetical protein EDB86DRAFT_3242551 [Lactarius hatsudake]